MITTFKYRLYPNKTQRDFFMKTFGCVRFVYNKMLEDRIRLYEESKLNPGVKQKLPTPAKYKPDFPFLAEVDSSALCNAQMNLNKAYSVFFKNKDFGFPKFKSKKRNKDSYTTSNQANKIRISGSKIRFPKVGFIKFKQHRLFDGLIKSATISMTKSGKFFVSLLVIEDDKKWIPAKNKIGIDLGLEYFAIMTNDEMVSEKIDNPRFLRKSESKVKKAQSKMDKKKVGSKNREKARIILAKKHEKISNQRKDFLNKLSRRIVDENQVIVIETLKSKEMYTGRGTSKSIGDASWNYFVRQLESKCRVFGRTLIKADQYFASSQICSSCGFRDGKKPTKIREWECKNCKTIHDRDINASINLLNLAN